MAKFQTPPYNPAKHPIETWQDWYSLHYQDIEQQVQQQRLYAQNPAQHKPPAFDSRLVAPYEYMDSLNQRQVWEPYLTGRERQEFDSQLRLFMKQNRSTMMRLRPAPQQIGGAGSSSYIPPK